MCQDGDGVQEHLDQKKSCKEPHLPGGGAPPAGGPQLQQCQSEQDLTNVFWNILYVIHHYKNNDIWSFFGKLKVECAW